MAKKEGPWTSERLSCSIWYSNSVISVKAAGLCGRTDGSVGFQRVRAMFND